MNTNSRIPASISLVASVLGLIFASTSTFDYAKHLDRRLHDVHCSFIPGAPATDQADACRAAMYSPYSALLKDDYWGGIPISLFAIGAFAFFTAFAVYLLVAGGKAPRKAVGYFALVSTTPFAVSVVMATISATQLGDFCKTCVGIYISSFLLIVGGLLGLATLGKSQEPPKPSAGSPYAADVAGFAARPAGSWIFPPVWVAALGLFTLLPSVVYASAMPDHRQYLSQCGKLKKPSDAEGALIHMATGKSVRPVTLFEDPLCPTCKAFHERLLAERIYDKLQVQLALFPLDSECNWMLDQPLHPGACLVSRAVLCGGEQARQVLEWAYDDQEYITRAGKAGEPTLRAVIKEKWGDAMLECVDHPQTKQVLNHHLHFAADNNIPVSTPQMYLDHAQRFCDEDTDIGLRYTLAQLAPEVLR